MLAVIRGFLRDRRQRQRRCVGSGTHRKCFSQERIYQQDRAAPLTGRALRLAITSRRRNAGSRRSQGRVRSSGDYGAGAPIAPACTPDHLTVVGVPLATDHGDAQGRWFWNRRSSADQSFLINCSAANWAFASDAKSSGVTTLRTLSPPTLPIRTIGIMSARQCLGFRR